MPSERNPCRGVEISNKDCSQRLQKYLSLGESDSAAHEIGLSGVVVFSYGGKLLQSMGAKCTLADFPGLHMGPTGPFSSDLIALNIVEAAFLDAQNVLLVHADWNTESSVVPLSSTTASKEDATFQALLSTYSHFKSSAWMVSNVAYECNAIGSLAIRKTKKDPIMRVSIHWSHESPVKSGHDLNKSTFFAIFNRRHPNDVPVVLRATDMMLE